MKAGIDDHAIFGLHRRADRADQFLVALVVFVLAVRNDAGRRGDGKKSLRDVDSFERRLEIIDVALQLGLSGIGDRPDADGLDRCRHAFARIELGVEFGEFLAVDAAREGIMGAGLDLAPLKTAQAFQHILRPADRFAELAVADDVDADFGLVAHDFGDGIFQARIIGGMVVRLARLLQAQEILQLGWPNKAADMRGENAIDAALH